MPWWTQSYIADNSWTTRDRMFLYIIMNISKFYIIVDCYLRFDKSTHENKVILLVLKITINCEIIILSFIVRLYFVFYYFVLNKENVLNDCPHFYNSFQFSKQVYAFSKLYKSNIEFLQMLFY